MKLAFSLQFGFLDGGLDTALHRAALPRHKVQRWIGHALQWNSAPASAPVLLTAEITVRIVGSEEARALNRDYRQRDYATNVLTFDYGAAPHLAADLLLCAPVIAQEVVDSGIALQAHYAHLIVHGTLHALGHDHETGEPEAAAMEALESRILLQLGFADPYGAEKVKAPAG